MFWAGGYILGVSHIVVEMEGGIFWEEGVDSGRVAHMNLLKRGGVFWEEGVDSGRVAYSTVVEKGVYSGRKV